MSKSGGCFSFFFRRADDVTQTMSKGGGGGACKCLHPPPFRKSCIRACVPPIQVQTPPPPHTWMAGYGPEGGTFSGRKMGENGVGKGVG